MQRKILAAIIGSGLAATPIAASRADTMLRDSQPVAGESKLTADSNLFFIVGIAAVAAAIVLLQEDEEGAPISA